MKQMFKVKRKDNDKIYQVLDTCCDNIFHFTYFLVWDNDGWRWRPADKFVPPNYNKEEKTND